MAITDPEVRRLEEIGRLCWPAGRTESIGGWLMSIDRGVTRRANSVLPNASIGDLSLADCLAAVESSYRRAGLDPCFKMTSASRPAGLDDALRRRGYVAEGHSVVLIASVGCVEHRPALPVDLAPDPAAGWLECNWAGPDADARYRIVERTGRPKVFALAHLAGRPAGAAMAAIVDGWCCITALRTLPSFRRRGVARALIAALAGWASQQDGRSLFLQVEVENTAARGLYASAGFREAYRYQYRTLKCPKNG